MRHEDGPGESEMNHSTLYFKHQGKAWGVSFTVTSMSECDDNDQSVGGEDERSW